MTVLSGNVAPRSPLAARHPARTAWRLVRTPPAGAAWNMACDHFLSEAVGRGDLPAVLRLYAWDPPAVSLGYNQSLRDVAGRIPELERRRIGLVRRPTGGAAVLHADEVTYSVALAPGSPLLASGLKSACERIHAAILAGLEELGVSGLALHAAPAAVPPAPRACFAAASRSEVAWRGRKLVGSAQRRLAGALLQHGSILLSGGQEGLAALWPDAGRASAATLAEAAGRRLGWPEVADGVRRGFERELGAAFEESGLEPRALKRIAELERARYGSRAFLLRL